MNTTTKRVPVKVFKALNVCFDVGKDKLNSLYEHQTDDLITIETDEFRNNSTIILKKLEKVQKKAEKLGFKVVRVICEPTGIYHHKLLKIARRLGMLTNYVNTESVSKMRVVESNDAGKTDTKDPRIINTLAKLGKVLIHRVFSEGFTTLRQLNVMYEFS